MIRKAFTLIELLVVIAIIAILAAILFPVFAQAKNAAKKTGDLSNMKQLLLASQMYANDHDDKFHRLRNSPYTPPAGSPKWAWGAQDMLAPYIKSEDLFASPGDSIQRDDCDASSGKTVSYSWTHLSNYAVGGDWRNRQGYGLHGYSSTDDSMIATGVGAPASTISLYPLWTTAAYQEGYGYYRWNNANLRSLPLFPKMLSFTWCSAKPLAARMSIGAFGEQTNWGFADGHAKAQVQNSIMDPMWVSNDNQAFIDLRRNLVHYDERMKN